MFKRREKIKKLKKLYEKLDNITSEIGRQIYYYSMTDLEDMKRYHESLYRMYVCDYIKTDIQIKELLREL